CKRRSQQTHDGETLIKHDASTNSKPVQPSRAARRAPKKKLQSKPCQTTPKTKPSATLTASRRTFRTKRSTRKTVETESVLAASAGTAAEMQPRRARAQANESQRL